MRDLRGRPERELAGLELRGGRTRLHRVRNEALVDDPLRDRDLRVLERLVDVAALDRVREDEVRAELLVNDRCAWFEGLGGVDHHGEGFVVDRDQVRGPLCGVARIRDDRDDRIAGVSRLVDGDRHVLRAVHARHRDEHRQHSGRLELFAGQHCDDAGLLLGGSGVDPSDPRVRVRASHEGHVRHALQHYVVGEGRIASDETRVFLPSEARADVGRVGRGGHRFTSAATFG